MRYSQQLEAAEAEKKVVLYRTKVVNNEVFTTILAIGSLSDKLCFIAQR